MTSRGLLRVVVEALESAGIPYMLTGSYASSIHGRARATQDLDLVIAPTLDQLQHFVSRFPAPQYYVSEQAALEALRSEDQFNLIEPSSGWKVDLIVRKSRPFSRIEFERRQRAEIDGFAVAVASAEDVLIAKLEWTKRGESERQLEDAAGILRVRGPELDRGYVEGWVSRLGLENQWQATLRLT